MRKGIYGYPSMRHIIDLLPGDWEDHLLKMNEVVCEHI